MPSGLSRRLIGSALIVLLGLSACASQPEDVGENGERRHGALILKGVPEVPAETLERMRHILKTGKPLRN